METAFLVQLLGVLLNSEALPAVVGVLRNHGATDDQLSHALMTNGVSFDAKVKALGGQPTWADQAAAIAAMQPGGGVSDSIYYKELGAMPRGKLTNGDHIYSGRVGPLYFVVPKDGDTSRVPPDFTGLGVFDSSSATLK